MIADKFENIETYTGISKALAVGLNLLKEVDFTSVPDGKYFADSEGVFYMVQSYETKEQNDTPEAHRKYIDIQYIVSGEEKIGFGNLGEMTEVKANPEGDIWFYRGPMSYVTLRSGSFEKSRHQSAGVNYRRDYERLYYPGTFKYLSAASC